MTPEEKAFVQAIIDDPETDVHRLIYADWLEEQGHPEHADFIRIQCEMEQIWQSTPIRERWEIKSVRPRYRQLKQVQDQLHDAVARRWESLVPQEIAGWSSRGRLHFSRGALSELCVSLGEAPDSADPGSFDPANDLRLLQTTGDLLFQYAPIRHLSVSGVEYKYSIGDFDPQPGYPNVPTSDVQALVDLPILTRLTTLRINGPFDDVNAVCLALAHSPRLRQLQRLHVYNVIDIEATIAPVVQDVGPAAAEALIQTFGNRVRWETWDSIS